MRLDVEEIVLADLDAQLVAENIANQLNRRISHSRAMKASSDAGDAPRGSRNTN